IDVTFSVSNLGQVITPTGQSHWTDAVYLSLTNQLSTGNPLLLGTIPNGSALDVGQSYTSSGTFTLPVPASGNVFIIVKADLNDQVDEGPITRQDTAAAALAVNATPVLPPDLVMSNVSVPSTVFDGSPVTVHYQVTNKGAGPTFPDSWTDAVWLTLGK